MVNLHLFSSTPLTRTQTLRTSGPARAFTLTLGMAGVLSTPLVSGCGAPMGEDEDGTRLHWAAVADPAHVRDLSTEPQPCGDCVDTRLEVVLGDTEGPGYVVLTSRATRDSLGRYWLGQYRDMIKVFDSAGTFIRSIGREGEGPGEFLGPWPAFTDAEGMVHVLDDRTLRKTVFRPDFTVAGMTKIPVPPRAYVPLHGREEFVVNSPVQTVESLGHPLHFCNETNVLHSFGAQETGITDINDLHRLLTTDGSGRVYSVPPDKFEIEVWNQHGERITKLEGPSLGEGDPEKDPNLLYTPETRITAVNVDTSERLWMLVSKPREDWRSHMVEVPTATGKRRLKPLDGEESRVFFTELLVVDLQGRSIIAKEDLPGDFVAFLGERRILELRELEDGTPQMGVWTIRLAPNLRRGVNLP